LLRGSLNPFIDDDLSVGDRVVIGSAIGHTAWKFRNLDDKGIIFLTPVDNHFISASLCSEPNNWRESFFAALILIHVDWSLCIVFKSQFTIFGKCKHWPPSHLPVITIKIGEVSTKTTPKSFLWFFYDICTCRPCTFNNSNNLVLTACIMSKSNSAKAIAMRWNFRSYIISQRFKWIKRNPSSRKLNEDDTIIV